MLIEKKSSQTNSKFTKANMVEASPFKGKSFWWEFKLPPKTRLLPTAYCLLPSLTSAKPSSSKSFLLNPAIF
jgi:hypothetical protein